MSTENSTFGQISDRLLILIDKTTGGSVSLFSRKTGINDKTLYTYLKGRAPSAEALFSICREFEININWLLTGKGPIYIYGEEKAAALEADPEIADLIEGARRVLKSGNAVAFDALERNIRYFDFAIQQEKDMAEQKKKLSEMEKRLSALEEKKTCTVPCQEEPSLSKKAV
jgi:transcriptional regulator with XRE-family HTH domain